MVAYERKQGNDCFVEVPRWIIERGRHPPVRDVWRLPRGGLAPLPLQAAAGIFMPRVREAPVGMGSRAASSR
jgi:hypothetical protein